LTRSALERPLFARIQRALCLLLFVGGFLLFGASALRARRYPDPERYLPSLTALGTAPSVLGTRPAFPAPHDHRFFDDRVGETALRVRRACAYDGREPRLCSVWLAQETDTAFEIPKDAALVAAAARLEVRRSAADEWLLVQTWESLEHALEEPRFQTE